MLRNRRIQTAQLAGVVVISLCAIMPAWAQTYIGVGAAASCGKWMHDRASGDYTDMGNWALGFLSGIAFTGRLDPLKSVDADAVFYWIDNECRDNPTNLFSTVVTTFALEHRK